MHNHTPKGTVIWFTGLSGAGKTTISRFISEKLKRHAIAHVVLDGDEVRKVLSPDLGYSPEDRKKHLQRVTYLATTLAQNNQLVLAAFVSGDREVRKTIRKNIETAGKFIEVYVKCPFQICAERDPQGHYKKVQQGTMTNFVGVDQPYQESDHPELVLETDKLPVEESAHHILEYLKQQGILVNNITASNNNNISLQAHGGNLVQGFMDDKKKKNILSQLTNFKQLIIGRDSILDAENIATGVFSPLQGFMNKADYESVVEKGRLTNNVPFTIPIVLPVPQEQAQQFHKKDQVILRAEDTTPIALLEVDDIFTYDKQKEAQQVYGTTDVNHPGVKRLFNRSNILISGKIELINRYPIGDFQGFNYDPMQTRKMFAEKGWKTIVGFQTRNAPHRAHEHLQKTALEHVDGLFIQPLVGWKKPGDFSPRVIIKAYQHAVAHFYNKNRVVFGILTTAMRYAGPREAVFHAIIRKNFGCTHFIIGRDHAGVGNYYAKYAGHAYADLFSDLGITIMKLHGPYYCKKCENIATEHTCPHDQEHHLVISGTEARKMLLKKQFPPKEFMRPEIAKIIMDDPESFIE
ncbi:sulfate adenylyltransferase [Candidatus Woesearchaeota archaeon]|nr:sulfate adenylyltransferase [Candidatus Woesearchaeota archaeon]